MAMHLNDMQLVKTEMDRLTVAMLAYEMQLEADGGSDSDTWLHANVQRAAVRRASMDVTRALADLRRNP